MAKRIILFAALCFPVTGQSELDTDTANLTPERMAFMLAAIHDPAAYWEERQAFERGTPTGTQRHMLHFMRVMEARCQPARPPAPVSQVDFGELLHLIYGNMKETGLDESENEHLYSLAATFTIMIPIAARAADTERVDCGTIFALYTQLRIEGTRRTEAIKTVVTASEMGLDRMLKEHDIQVVLPELP